MAWIVGVDVGGTFTDFQAYDPQSERRIVHKAPSTPDDPARAIVAGLTDLCHDNGIDLPCIARLAHGTTVATNALLQRRGGKVALVTTKGFRDLLEIGRQTRPHMFNMHEDNPAPLVPRHLRLEIEERMLASGDVRTPINQGDIDAALATLSDADIDSCAVCFLFSFVNPAHERAVGEILSRALPGIEISISSDVQAEFREYERLSTTVLNAYLQPIMANYIKTLGHQLATSIPNARVGINQSSGGLMSAERAARYPVRTALSGPAAGAIGAADVARLASRPNVITLDMGGTSADIALIRAYAAGLAFDRSVGGFPVRLPMLDINTIGAGGGSIAWFERDGMLKVGPISAGAVPGPACYGLGGDRPTVTDANLLLGRLSPAGLLGGRMALDWAAAERAFRPIAKRLGVGIERAARGVVEIVVSNMVRAIRAVSVERGHDPRDFVLLPFGGAGPLHAVDCAESLGIREILVPPSPGILCAEGLLVSDLKEDFVRSRRLRLADDGSDEVAAALASLHDEAADWFAQEGVDVGNRVTTATLDMRYVRQNFELPVSFGYVSDGRIPGAEDLRRMFHKVHEMNYGHFSALDPVEIVNLRMTARARQHAAPRPAPPSSVPPLPPPSGRRAVHFRDEVAVDTPVYDRAALSPGQTLVGPAAIDQLDSTTLLYPGQRLAVDPAFNLLIEVA